MTAGAVTQEDRDAAWSFRPFCYKDNQLTREKWNDGVYDGIPLIQAFAAHRIAATRASDDVVEALRTAVEIADQGIKACPVNNPALATGSSNACTKCGHGPDKSCPSLDGANYRAVQLMREALAKVRGEVA